MTGVTNILMLVLSPITEWWPDLPELYCSPMDSTKCATKVRIFLAYICIEQARSYFEHIFV